MMRTQLLGQLRAIGKCYFCLSIYTPNKDHKGLKILKLDKDIEYQPFCQHYKKAVVAKEVEQVGW